MSRSRRGKSGRLLSRVDARKLNIAGWSSLVARRAHNPKVVGSNPAPATTKQVEFFKFNLLFCVHIKVGNAALAAGCVAEVGCVCHTFIILILLWKS